MSKKVKLDEADVIALRALMSYARRHQPRDAAYHAEISRVEAELPPNARSAWRDWPSEILQDELKRWVSCYKIERTRQGYRALPYLKTVKRYRKTPEQTRLTSTEAAKLREMLIRT